MKTEARKMAEKMSKSKKNEDINEMAREINRGGKPRGISSDIPAGIREKLMDKERQRLYNTGYEGMMRGAATGAGKPVEPLDKATMDKKTKYAEAMQFIKDYDEEAANKMKEKKLAKGGMLTKQEAKVGKVMKEFKAGSLHSGKGGKVVKNPKQAVAIALSEARRMKK